MKVVVSVGGSVLAPRDAGRVAAHADALAELDAGGHELGVVVGGGGIAREYIGTARELGANEMQLDEVGIAATRLNARLLIAALGERAAPTPPTDYEAAGLAMRRGDLPVMGGVTPAQTTDAVAAVLAEYVDADLLVYATNVPGVYDADPDEDPDATRFEELSAAALVEVVGDIDLSAGSNAPVDLLAAKVIRRAGLRTIVMDGTDPDRLVRAVRDGDHGGTEVVPGEEP